MRRLFPVILLTVFAVASPAAAAIPEPAADPFYKPPAGFESKAPGAILRTRQVTVTGAGAPLPVRSWQLLYRSNDTQGRPIAGITTLIVPLTPYSGRRPLVSYQAAIDSLGDQCNPSYNLRTGTQRELPALQPLIAAGWAITVPDFEGPRHAYGAGVVAARTTLDGIRATLRFGPAGLVGAKTPTGLWGYSGGGQATAWAAEQQASYAPELDLTAVAAGGVPPDVEQVAHAIDGSVFFGIYAAVAVGLDREYPELDIDSLLNADGKTLKQTIADQCIDDFGTAYPFKHMSDYTTVADPLAVPRVRKVIEAITLPKATPTAPLFIYHSTLDELIPVAGVDALVNEYCRRGATVFYRRDVAGEHVAYVATGGAQAFAYLAARFSGLEAPNNCGERGRPGPSGTAVAGCLSQKSPIGRRRIGRVRLGFTRRRLSGRARVLPIRRTRRTWTYCVNGGAGRLTAVFSKRSSRGRVALITTTAPGHGNRSVKVRSRGRRFRSAYPGRARIARGLFRARARSQRLFGVRRGRVRFIGVAGRSLLARRPALLRALRRAGVRG